MEKYFYKNVFQEVMTNGKLCDGIKCKLILIIDPLFWRAENVLNIENWIGNCLTGQLKWIGGLPPSMTTVLSQRSLNTSILFIQIKKNNNKNCKFFFLNPQKIYLISLKKSFNSLNFAKKPLPLKSEENMFIWWLL